MVKIFSKDLIKVSTRYFLLTGIVTILAIIYNFILIDKININLNITFCSSFLIFGFLSYSLNSIFNFKQKLSLKKYLLFFQNNLVVLILTLIFANILNINTQLPNLMIVIFSTLFNALLNFLLNLKITFKFF
jgi:hypothetical protein